MAKRIRREFTNEEDKFITDNWGKIPVSEMVRILGRKHGTIYGRAEKLCLDTSTIKTRYIVYRGDDFLCEGNADECAREAQVTRDFIYIAASEQYKKRLENRKPHSDRLTVIKLKQEELA